MAPGYGGTREDDLNMEKNSTDVRDFMAVRRTLDRPNTWEVGVERRLVRIAMVMGSDDLGGQARSLLIPFTVYCNGPYWDGVGHHIPSFLW